MKNALILALASGVALGAPCPASAEPQGADPAPARGTHAVGVPGSVRSDVLSGLLNAAPDRVRSELGDPAVARTEGRGAFWTYQAPHCALYIFFKDRGGLHVSGAAAGPRQRGLAVPAIEACLGELEKPPLPAGRP